MAIIPTLLILWPAVLPGSGLPGIEHAVSVAVVVAAGASDTVATHPIPTEAATGGVEAAMASIAAVPATSPKLL